MKTNSIIVNKTEIAIYNYNNEKTVAIKSICKALGIDYSRQLKKIKEDDILKSFVGISPTVASDGKEREMVNLPLKYVFGWLFTINPKNVKKGIKTQIINYKEQCYNALFEIFTKRDNLLKEKTKYKTEINELEKELKDNEKFQKIQELKLAIKKTAKQFNELNKNVIDEQLRLF